jgi:hypothetical protein
MGFFLSHFLEVAPPMELASVVSHRPQPSHPNELTQAKVDHFFLGSGSGQLHRLSQKLFVQVNVRMSHEYLL